jgi:nicotinamidase-related amidase
MEAQSSAQPRLENRTGLALLVIDVQEGLFGKSSPIYRADQLLENINILVDRAHQAGVPVFYVQHADQRVLVEGSDGWQLHARLRPAKTDVIVHKHHSNAFQDTALEAELKSRGVGRVIVAGLVSHGCVKSTCLGAKELGYRVTLAGDAHSSFSKDAARLIAESNEKLGHGVADVRATQEIEMQG